MITKEGRLTTCPGKRPSAGNSETESRVSDGHEHRTLGKMKQRVQQNKQTIPQTVFKQVNS